MPRFLRNMAWTDFPDSTGRPSALACARVDRIFGGPSPMIEKTSPMIEKTSLSLLALVASASLASAADLEGPTGYYSMKDGYAAPAAYNWTGFYVGFNVGHAWADHESFLPENLQEVAYVPEGGIRTDLNPDGWFGGGQIGFNFQTGPLVLGVEADWQGASMDDSTSSIHIHTLENDVEFSIHRKVHVDQFGTVRGRIGWALGHVLPYLTGGFAWAKAEADGSIYYLIDATWRGSDSQTHTGWVLGGGVEVALGENWTARAEYLHFDLGDRTYTITYTGPWPGDTYKAKADFEMNTFRIGVNYKFGG